MYKREFKAASKPQFKAFINTIEERNIEGNRTITATAVKKANRIRMESESLMTIYKFWSEMTGGNLRDFRENTRCIA